MILLKFNNAYLRVRMPTEIYRDFQWFSVVDYNILFCVTLFTRNCRGSCSNSVLFRIRLFADAM